MASVRIAPMDRRRGTAMLTDDLHVSRGSRQRYGRLNEYDPEPYLDNEIQDNADDDDDEDVPGECGSRVGR